MSGKRKRRSGSNSDRRPGQAGKSQSAGRATGKRASAAPNGVVTTAPWQLGWADGLAALALAALVVAAYADALSAPFVYDDYGSIVENASVHWREINLENLRGAWLDSTTRRVVANWSFGLDHRMWGLDPAAYHATNIGIHATTCLLVYALLLHLLSLVQAPTVGGSSGARSENAIRVAALVGAAIFAAHPLATQAVTYIVQRMASLATLFCVASLLFYARGRAASGRARGGWWGLAVLAWGLALGSKENAATFPAVIALYEWLLRRGADRQTALRLGGAVAVAAIAALMLMRFNYGDPFRDTFYHDFTLGERLLSQPRVLAYYASLIVWPDPGRLSLMHDFAPSRGLFSPAATLPALLGLLAAIGLAVRFVDRWPLGVFALGWWGLGLAVETSVFPLRLAHEHRLYLPMVGVAIAIAWGVRVGLERARTGVLVGAAIVVALLAGATHVRNEAWQSRESIWRDVVEKSPRSGIGYANLAAAFIDDERYDEALLWLERGREAAPDYPGIPRGIGLVYGLQGDNERSLELLLRAVALDPLDHTGIGQVGVLLTRMGRADEALRYFEESTRIFEHPRVVNHHGKALARLGRYSEALEKHRRALFLAPDDGYVHVALGTALAATGQREEARRVLQRALDFEDPVGARVELAGLSWVAGDAAGAVAHLRAALLEQPDASVALNNLAWMLATAADPEVRRPAEALDVADRLAAELREHGVELDAETLDTIAAAEAGAGEFERAEATTSRAIARAREADDEDLARDIERRRDLYRAGQTYLDPVSSRRSQ